jgi:hypothetical protein
MKNTTDTSAKSHSNWKTTMQQAGYQVQDFIVQVQGGQSALVAFSQQGLSLRVHLGLVARLSARLLPWVRY